MIIEGEIKYSVFQSAEVQKLWVLGKRQKAIVKGLGEVRLILRISGLNAS